MEELLKLINDITWKFFKSLNQSLMIIKKFFFFLRIYESFSKKGERKTY